MNKPTLVYVDDQPHNLTVFEASLPDDWQLHTYDSPLKALQDIANIKPWVVVSDQRMPGMHGVEFLELARKLSPQSVRIIVTGYSDEELIIESVRKAQVFDYIRKPWDQEEIEASLGRALEFYRAVHEKDRLFNELEEKTKSLLELKIKFEEAAKAEANLRSELECWVPPFVLWALRDKTIHFPIKRDIIGITFDIVRSRDIHNITVANKPLRSLVIQRFSESIIRNGGWRESLAGDSAYAHFGLINKSTNPADAALAAAREFRVALRSLSEVGKVNVECGIALHVAKEACVDVHTVQLNTPTGIVSQKSFDTTSTEIDLLHRIEKMTHELPGSNIIMTEGFVNSLSQSPGRLVDLGAAKPDGHQDMRLYLLPSDMVSEEILEAFKLKFQFKQPSDVAA
jgi:FixJ family two-component response regulator/class 3 adenylate cyclase